VRLKSNENWFDWHVLVQLVHKPVRAYFFLDSAVYFVFCLHCVDSVVLVQRPGKMPLRLSPRLYVVTGIYRLRTVENGA